MHEVNVVNNIKKTYCIFATGSILGIRPLSSGLVQLGPFYSPVYPRIGKVNPDIGYYMNNMWFKIIMVFWQFSLFYDTLLQIKLNRCHYLISWF